MGFKNFQSNIVAPVDLKKEVKKNEMQLRIDAMGVSVKELEDKKVKLEQETEQVLGASSDLATINTQLAAAESKLEEINKKIELGNKQFKTFEEIKENVSQETKKLDELKAEVKELAKITADYPVKKQEYEDLLQKISDAHSTFSDLQISNGETLKDTKNKIKEAQDVLTSGLVEIKESKKLTKEASETLLKEKEKITKAQADLKSVLGTTKQAEIQSKLNIEAEIAKKQAEFDEKYAKKTVEIEKREGEISEKSALLTEKENQLRSTKIELEKFYNRKISHIII